MSTTLKCSAEEVKPDSKNNAKFYFVPSSVIVNGSLDVEIQVNKSETSVRCRIKEGDRVGNVLNATI